MTGSLEGLCVVIIAWKGIIKSSSFELLQVLYCY